MASCLAVQHVEPEEPFAIADALRSAGVDVDIRRLFAGDRLPSGIDAFDALVVMGGPMSAARDDGFPSRREEIGLLAAALERALPVLGVCLGAQLLAVAAGGTVHTGPAPEVGWGTVQLTAAAATDPLFAGLADPLTVLHWHGDTYVPPPRAVRLASSAAYPEQAFRVGPAAWGLQFHLEVDIPAVGRFVRAFAAEAASAGTPPDQISGGAPEVMERLGPVRQTVFDRFATLAAGGAVSAVVPGRVSEPA